MFLKKQDIGKDGEDVAEKFLIKEGFKVLERNYRKQWGEIDLIALKSGAFHFVEVKTKTGTKEGNDYYEAEERVDREKRRRLARVIQTYLSEHKAEEKDFFVHVCAVYRNHDGTIAEIRFIEDIELL